MTPSKPPDVLRRLHRNLQSRANDVREDNQSATTARPRKQCKRLNRAAHADGSIANPQTIEDRVREKGRNFVVQEALFLVDTDVFTVDEDEDFDPIDEFTSDKKKIQGQLRQIMCYLPDDVKHLRTTDLISGRCFADGMSGQRSSTSNRLRFQSIAKIVDDIKPFATSSGRFDAFTKFIGYQPGTNTREPYYSKLDVPVLYDGWQGKKDVNTLFRNPILLKIHASIIRGPNGAEGLFSGKSKRPTARTVERMYKIHRTVPGAITNSAVLAIWLHSADTQLVEIGNETGINYQILEGLATDKARAVGLLRTGTMSCLEAEEDEEDFFSSAPLSYAPRSLSPPPQHRSSSPTPPPMRHRSSLSPPPLFNTSSQGSRRHLDRTLTMLPAPRRSDPSIHGASINHDRDRRAPLQSSSNVYRR
ncbi:hypothetical protein B0H10DRAFT_2128674 [Mycena sp. CBHHK59/15]|nr:hypothetical protein B0H10DRAFT_2128674 [Mycena sp. CBHHK59/15]